MSVKELPREKCADYINRVMVLEMEAYQLGQLEDRLTSEQKRMQSAEIPELLPAPEKPDERELRKRAGKMTLPRYISEDPESITASLIIGMVFAALLVGFFWLLDSFSSTMWPTISKAWLIAAPIIAILTLLVNYSDDKKNRGTVMTYDEVLRSRTSVYDGELSACEARAQEHDEMVAAKKNAETRIPVALEVCRKRREETQALLEKFYDLDVIVPKYRALVPVSCFCEYFFDGSCDTLTGHDGAYNLYERELRMNTVLGQIDEVNSRLDEILETQSLLAEAITQTNDMLDELTEYVDAASREVEMTSYYSQISDRNAACASALMVWNDL